MKRVLAAALALSFAPALALADAPRTKLDVYCRVTAVHDGLFEESLGVHGDPDTDEDSTYVSIEIDLAKPKNNYVGVGGAAYFNDGGDLVTAQVELDGSWGISAVNGDSATSGHTLELLVKFSGDKGTVDYSENGAAFSPLADFDCSKQ